MDELTGLIGLRLLKGYHVKLYNVNGICVVALVAAESTCTLQITNSDLLRMTLAMLVVHIL